jgi:hypothetical protein
MADDLIIEAEGGKRELCVVTLLVEVAHGPLELLIVVLGLFEVGIGTDHHQEVLSSVVLTHLLEVVSQPRIILILINCSSI